MHKCEGEEEALVRSDLLRLSSESGAQVNFLWETSSQVVENQFGTGTDNVNKKKRTLGPQIVTILLEYPSDSRQF